MAETCMGFELEKWKPANLGFTAVAEKGGKTYFLKKYNHYLMPQKSKMKEETFEKKKKEFLDFKNYRQKINSTLRTLSGSGGNIIAPITEFTDGIYFVEASEFVDGLIEDKDIFDLPEDDILFIMLTTAAALAGIHRLGIVHSDLKRGNIVAAKKASSGKIVGKIMDFDKSYFEKELPPANDIGGDQNYLSPELTNCFFLDFDEESLENLSTASDVFSLGLVFYNYLTKGRFPEIIDMPDYLEEREVVYAGEALIEDARLVIKESEIKEQYMRHLIARMLEFAPEDRPTAMEVVGVLKNKTVLDLIEDSQILVEETAEEPEYDEDEEDIFDAEDEEAEYDEDEEIAFDEEDEAEYDEDAEESEIDLCDPWPEHDIEFNIEKLKSNGIVSMERAEKGSAKTYKATFEDGATRPYSAQLLKSLNLATDAVEGEAEADPMEDYEPSEAIDETAEYVEIEEGGDNVGGPTEICDPWPLHKMTFDLDRLKESKVVGVERTSSATSETYKFYFEDGTSRPYSEQVLKMLGLAKARS